MEEIARLHPDVAVVDIGLPGIDGIELTRRARLAVEAIRVVILTMQTSDTYVFAALAAGADAYVVKTADPSSLVRAVRIAAEGGAYFDPQIAGVVLRSFGGDTTPGRTAAESPWTPGETEILRLIAEGVGNVEIAERLNLGFGTVKGHIHDIFTKLEVSDRAQAAVKALRGGFL